MARGTRTKGGQLDWHQALTAFFGSLEERERSPHTMRSYRETLLEFGWWYRDTFEELPVVALIQAGEIREWKSHLRDKLKLGPNTVNWRLAGLRSFLGWAAAEGIAPEIATPKGVAQVLQPPRWLDAREQRALLRWLDRHGNGRDPALVRLLIHTGLRVDELTALNIEDCTVRERSGTLVVRKGKGRKQRSIPLNAEAREAIGLLCRTYTASFPRRKGPMVLGQQGPLTVRGVQVIVARAGKGAGLDGLSPHVLRHTFGHNLAVKGVPIQVIADLMGHESLETTRRYVQPGRDDLAAAVETIAGGMED